MDISKFAATVGTSVFEAKAGIKPAVCALKLGEGIVGPLLTHQLAKKAFRELGVYFKSASDWGACGPCVSRLSSRRCSTT